MSNLTAFNNLFDKFLGDLVRWNPDMKDFQVIQTSAQLLRSMNARVILIQFMYYISKTPDENDESKKIPYYVHILNKNEEFFKDTKNININEVPEQLQNYSEDQIIDKIVAFKDNWETYSDDRKERIWKMLKALVKIGSLASNNPLDKKILEYIKANPHLF